MHETKQDLNRRLHQEGRYGQYRERLEQVVAERGVNYAEARKIVAPEFPPLYQAVEPPATETPRPSSSYESHYGSPKTYWDILSWVCTALGRCEAGWLPSITDCPTDEAWGILTWARRNPRDFYSIWAQEGRRQGSLDSAVAEQTRLANRQIEAVRVMLSTLEEDAEQDSPVTPQDVLEKGIGK